MKKIHLLFTEMSEYYGVELLMKVHFKADY